MVVLKLFGLDIKNKFQRAMEFRLNFMITLITSLCYNMALPLFQFFIFKGINGFPGWTVDEVILFQAVLLFWTGIIEFLFGGVRNNIGKDVLHGGFDRIFLWPHHPLVSIFTRGIDIFAFSTVLTGLACIMIVSFRLGLPMSCYSLLLFIVFFFCGIIFYVSLLIIYCALTVLLIKMDRLQEVLDKVFFFGSFPVDLYHGFGKIFFLVIFPSALWIHIPSRVLLGNVDELSFYSVITSLLFFICSVLFWEYQVKRYTSSGG
ncbi:ABC transporter permease [Sporocytophaga myxococcoides]|uniref:ABC transporter permease n=1 Tax=Sporocytophaga myxococcoides TaxID=153721 RepID=UPI000419F09C|nr:ABC-2 family transporter protein [Sporocytophaga myxococcoides]